VSRQKRPRPGELRQWKFSLVKDKLKGGLGGGEFFTVIDVDGVRVDVMNSDGTTEGYFLDWLMNNSVVVKS